MSFYYEISIQGKIGADKEEELGNIFRKTLDKNIELVSGLVAGAPFVVIIDDPIRVWGNKEEDMYPAIIAMLEDDEFVRLRFDGEDDTTAVELLDRQGVKELDDTPVWEATTEMLEAELLCRKESIS